jgi:peptidoglycan hydrolase-like protein with peptidoglycan-binding domain
VLTEERPFNVSPQPGPKRRTRRLILAGVGGVAIVLVAFAAASLGLSGTTVARGRGTSLAEVEVQPLGGDVQSVTATGPGGKPVPVALHDGHVVPTGRLSPGEPVELTVVVRRPSVVGWLAGGESTEHLSVRAPVNRVGSRWLTVAKGDPPRVSFERPVTVVAYGAPGELKHRRFAHPRRSFSLGAQPPAGSVVVAGSVASWERLGSFQTVTWFPAGGAPAVAASPVVGSDVTPSTPLHLTFSKPVAAVLGSAMPKLSPAVPGHWVQADRHTVEFRPAGFGAPFGVTLKARLPRRVDVVDASGSAHSASEVEWKVPAGSTLRLQQLLAKTGYLPVEWKPHGAPVAKTPEAQVHAAVDPPSGHFSWRFHGTPPSLREIWQPGEAEVVTEGAVMAFEEDHEMETDGVAGPAVWEALMKDAIAGKRRPEPGYSYVQVSETLPETVKVWHNGHYVVEGAANTGIPGAETELGTFPVFEHLEETTMSGENPDGSHYEDPGIMWVSYFNGGDALHAFDRASFGTPQSLGCVEMPLEEAADVYPYTPIGTLVTVAG